MSNNSQNIEKAINELKQYYNVLGKNDFFQYIITESRRNQESREESISTSGGATDESPTSNDLADLLMNLSDGGIYAYEFLRSPLWNGLNLDAVSEGDDSWSLIVDDINHIKTLLKVICHEDLVPDPLITEVDSLPTGESGDPSPAETPVQSPHPAAALVDPTRTFSRMLHVDRESRSRPALNFGERFKDLIPNKSKTSLVAFQLYPCYLNLSQRDTGALQLFLSSIPPLEWSRATPFVSAEIITPQSPLDQSGRPQGISSIRFLDGKTEIVRHSPAHDMVTGRTENLSQILQDANERNEHSRRIIEESDISDEEKEGLLQTIRAKEYSSAGMEVFTSPQTLVPAGEKYINYDSVMEPGGIGEPAWSPDVPGSPGSTRMAPVIDKMRPFMSLTALEINVQPSTNFVSTKSAKLMITLHDRSRLGEISELVKPDSLGHTEVLLEYGWSHPAGFANNPEGEKNAYGQLINSMRVKEKYGVYNTAYSFTEDGQVLITLELITRGAISIDYMDIAMDPKTRLTWMEIQRLTEIVAEKRAEVMGTEGFADVTGMETVAMISPSSLGDVFSGEEADEINSFLEYIGEGAGSSEGELARALVSLREKVRESQRTMNDAYTEKMRIAKNGVDPFLFDNDGQWVLPTNRHYVSVTGFTPRRRNRTCSFGKLMMLFVGMPLAVSGMFDEVQLLFYNFNERSGWMKGKNVGSFPVPVYRRGDGADFHSRFENELEKYIQWPIGRFVNWVKTIMFSSVAAIGWGLGETYEYTADGRAVTRGERDVDVRGQNVPNEDPVDEDSPGLSFYERYVQAYQAQTNIQDILKHTSTGGVMYKTAAPTFRTEDNRAWSEYTNQIPSGNTDDQTQAHDNLPIFPSRMKWAWFLIWLMRGHPDVFYSNHDEDLQLTPGLRLYREGGQRLEMYSDVRHPLGLKYFQPMSGMLAGGGTTKQFYARPLVDLRDAWDGSLYRTLPIPHNDWAYADPAPHGPHPSFCEYLATSPVSEVSGLTGPCAVILNQIFMKWFGTDGSHMYVQNQTYQGKGTLTAYSYRYAAMNKKIPLPNGAGLFGTYNAEHGYWNYGIAYPSLVPDQLDPVIAQDMNIIMRIMGMDPVTGDLSRSGWLSSWKNKYFVWEPKDYEEWIESDGAGRSNPYFFMDLDYPRTFCSNLRSSYNPSPGGIGGTRQIGYDVDGKHWDPGSAPGRQHWGHTNVSNIEHTHTYIICSSMSGINASRPKNLRVSERPDTSVEGWEEDSRWEVVTMYAYPPGSSLSRIMRVPDLGRGSSLSGIQGRMAPPRYDQSRLSSATTVQSGMNSAIHEGGNSSMIGGAATSLQVTEGEAMLHAQGLGLSADRSVHSRIITGITAWSPQRVRLETMKGLFPTESDFTNAENNPLWVAAEHIGLAPGETRGAFAVGGTEGRSWGTNTTTNDLENLSSRFQTSRGGAEQTFTDLNFDEEWAERSGVVDDWVFYFPTLKYTINDTGVDFHTVSGGTYGTNRSGWGGHDAAMTTSGDVYTYSDHEIDMGENASSNRGIWGRYDIQVEWTMEPYQLPTETRQFYKDMWRLWFATNRRVQHFKESAFATHITVQTDLGYLTAKRQQSLAYAYYGRGYANGMDISFRLPALRMIIETIPHKNTNSLDSGPTSNNSGTICRVHFVDTAAMKYPSLGKVLRAAKNTEMGQLSGIMTEFETDENPDLAKYGEQIATTIRSLEQQGIIELAEVPALDSTDTNQDIPRHRIVGGPPAIKNFIKRNMPSIVFGVQNSAIINAHAKTINNSRDMTIHLLRNQVDEGVSVTVGQEEDLGLAMKMLPFNLSLTMFGCPLIHHTQQFFVDFGTNTSVDNIFAVTGVSHILEPGKFETKCKLIPIYDAYGMYQGLLETTFDASSELSTINPLARAEARRRRGVADEYQRSQIPDDEGQSEIGEAIDYDRVMGVNHESLRYGDLDVSAIEEALSSSENIEEDIRSILESAR